MTFPVTGIPNAGDDPSVSQGQIQTNFNSIIGWAQVDHVGYGASNVGTHNQVTFANATSPVPSPAGTVGVLYSQLQAGVSQLFFRNATGVAQLTGDTGALNPNGSATMSNGLIIKWGQGSIATGGGGTDVPFASDFANSCLAVVVSGRNSGNTPGSFVVNGIDPTKFNLYANVSGNFYYIAVGF